MKEKIKLVYMVVYILSSDIYRLFRNSYAFRVNTKYKRAAKIMLTAHSIEKGLSFRVKRKSWGGRNASLLCRRVLEYLNLYGYDDRVDMAINVLSKYKDDTSGDKNESLIQTIEKICDQYRDKLRENIGGTKLIPKPTFACSYDEIFQFYLSRSSVRYFSDIPLSKDEIERVYRLVETTPTACNRQACSLYVFQDKSTIKELIDSQLGDQGWCYNADALFIVTANQSYFNATYERFETYIDGGMFAMNVVMALHAQKIASCCKMFVQHPKLEEQVKRIAKITDVERPIMFILAGHYNDEAFESPLSKKLSLDINIR